MKPIVLLLLAACGPVVAVKGDPRESGRAALSDPSRVAGLIRGSVINGGLWFDDPRCAKEFGVPGEVRGDRVEGFAACIAGLRMEASARESMLGDVVIMRYPPGIEIEARVVHEADGARLRWIGYASRRAGDLDFPTITHDALERLRLAGDRTGPLDPDVQAELDRELVERVERDRSLPPDMQAALVWLKVCLDEAGALTTVAPYTTSSSKTAAAFQAAVSKWRFRPFITRGRPLAVCAMVRMAHPVDLAPSIEKLPLPPPPSRTGETAVVFASPRWLEPTRIAGTRFVVPDDDTKRAILHAGITKIVGTFRLCLDDGGVAESVLPITSTGIARYDRRITAALWGWKYQPVIVEGKAVPFCTYVTFRYTQK